MLKYAWRELSRRRGRSIAAICSYLLATVIVGVLLSLLQYSEISQNKTLYDAFTDFIAFNPIYCNFQLLKDETQKGFFGASGSRSFVMSTNLKEKVVLSNTYHGPAAQAIAINHRLMRSVIIFIIFLIAVNIFRTHYASVIERKHEIGIFQSMGWSKKRIVFTVVFEFLLQALIGGIAGVCLTGICRLIVSVFKPVNYILCAFDPFGNTLLGFALIFIMAVISSISFALHIAKLLPVKNLRIV
jgi:ABC-type antimicrobial peptide transport system permease subunit